VRVALRRQVGDLVQDVIALGEEVEFTALRVGEQSADARGGDCRALFQQDEAGQPVGVAMGSGQTERLLHRCEQVPDGGAATST
jgi:hypothetical protein